MVWEGKRLLKKPRYSDKQGPGYIEECHRDMTEQNLFLPSSLQVQQNTWVVEPSYGLWSCYNTLIFDFELDAQVPEMKFFAARQVL